MGVLLNVRLYWFPLVVLDCEAKSGRIIILFLAPFQIDIHLLELVEEVIDQFDPVDCGLLFLGVE